MAPRPKCKTYNYEMWEKFHGIGFGSDFFGYDTKGTGNKKKNRQIGLPQNFCASKNTINKVKGNP